MNSKKNKRKGKKSGNNSKQIVTIGVLVVVLLILLAVLWKISGLKKESAGQRENQGNEAVEFPYSLEDGKIEVRSLFQYSGMNPDCKDESGEDIASLEIVNKSEEHLKNGEFTVKLVDGTEIPFVVADIPAGQIVWAYATDNSSYDASVACAVIKSDVTFEDKTSLLEDKLTIDVQETEVTLTNKSEENLKNLNVYCHCFFEEAYFGGLTYTYPVETIPAGKSITLQAEECYLGQAEVVRISQGD